MRKVFLLTFPLILVESCSTTDKVKKFKEKPYRTAVDMTRNFNDYGEYDGTWSVECPNKKVIRILDKRKHEADLCPPHRTHAEDWCYAREIQAKLTVSWLQNLYGIDDCFEMYHHLRKQTSLEIAGEGAEKLTDLEPLFGLSNLEKLTLNGSSFTRLDVLKTLPNLRVLNIVEGAWIRDTRPLKSLKQLESMHLDSKGNWGIKLPSLKNHSELKKVKMDYLSGGLRAFVGSEVESLTVTNIDDLGGLGDLEAIVHLDVKGCRSAFFPKKFEHLENLKNLKLRWCRLELLPPFEDLSSLEKLDLSYNKIRRIEFLSHSPVKTLKLHHNQISDLEPLRTLENLRYLNVVDNPEVRNLEPISNLESLRKVHLKGTRIYRIWRSQTARDRYLPLCPAEDHVVEPVRDFCRS